jgi:hypothetical protein
MEQLPNAILQGLYDSFSQELRIFKRKFYEWLPEQQMFSLQWQGEILNVCKEDFSSALEIIPCGQYSMESTAYKLMRAQLVLDQAKEMPQFHNMPQVLIKFYRDIGLKDHEIEGMVIVPQPTPPPPAMDPLTENTFILQSKPIKVYEHQEHQAHMTVHSLLLNHSDPQVVAAAHAHIKEHEAALMMIQLQMISGVQIPHLGQQQPGQPSQGGPHQQHIAPQNQPLSQDQENHLALALAAGAQQLNQQQEQQKPIDPGVIKLEEIKMRKETALIDAEIAMKKLDVEHSKTNIQAQIDSLDLAIKAQEQVRENIRLEVESQSSQIDNEIKKHNQQLDHLTAQLESMQKILDVAASHRDLQFSQQDATIENNDMINQT